MKFFGTRPTYQIFSGATFITGCMYYLFNTFYLRSRAAGDENDLCKKRPAEADVECRETKETKDNALDVATKIEKPDETAAEKPKVASTNEQAKLVPDNTDGGSDSGVDNPAFNETETSSNDSKKDVSKING